MDNSSDFSVKERMEGSHSCVYLCTNYSYLSILLHCSLWTVYISVGINSKNFNSRTDRDGSTSRRETASAAIKMHPTRVSGNVFCFCCIFNEDAFFHLNCVGPTSMLFYCETHRFVALSGTRYHLESRLKRYPYRLQLIHRWTWPIKHKTSWITIRTRINTSLLLRDVWPTDNNKPINDS